jgi:hypothetical protein
MNATSRDWLIEGNKLVQNRKAIRIAASQNHGVRPLAEPSSMLPQNHLIQNNEIQENVVGIELEKTIRTQMVKNTMNNLVANIREVE